MVSTHILRFGEFEIDPRSAVVHTVSGDRVALPPQPSRVLLHLVLHAGEVVTRQELRQEVWGDDTHVDFDRGLNFCVREIRRALGDDAQNPRFIQTLPRRGYCFLHPVEADPPPSGVPEGSEAFCAPPAERQADRNHRLLGIMALLVLALSVGAVLAYRWRAPTPASSMERTMLVVLPFENLTGEPSQDYLGDGLTEEVIAELARLDAERLGVIARTSSMHYKATRRRAGEIGRELGVDYLLEGSVRREGETVRITAQLIRVDDESHLWAEFWDFQLGGVLTFQKSISRRVADSLALALLQKEESIEVAKEASEAYLEGRYLASRLTQDGLERGIAAYQRALASAPDFARAHDGLAEAYLQLGYYGAAPAPEAYAEARRVGLRALELDASLAEARATVAIATLYLDFDGSFARRELETALKQAPGSARLHHWHALLLAAQGSHDEAREALARARSLDPRSALVRLDAGWYAYLARRYDDAREECQRTLEMEPSYLPAFQCLEYAAALNGDVEGAVDAARSLHQRIGTPAEDLEILKQAAGQRGLEGLWQWELERYRKMAESGQGPSFAVAAQLAVLGRHDEALNWLERAYEKRDAWIVFSAVEPMLDSLRSDPRFEDFMRRVQLKE